MGLVSLTYDTLPENIARIPARARRRWAQISAFEPDLPARLGTLVRSLKSDAQPA